MRPFKHDVKLGIIMVMLTRAFLSFEASLFILLCIIVSAATAATVPPDVKKVVTFVFLADEQGNLRQDPQTKLPMPQGTGFFVALKDTSSSSGGYGYFVTAKHVLKDRTGEFFNRVYLRLNKLSGDAEYVPLDLIQDGHSVVFTHSDATVDIAVVPALPNQTVFDFKVLTDEMLTTEESFSKLQLGEGSDVFFAGLLVQFFGEHRNYPVLRFGRVAMLPGERIPWSDGPSKPAELTQLYLLETQSYGGNSGSPVFFYLGTDRTPGAIVVGPPRDHARWNYERVL
jgi:hypothetical protein